MTTTPRILDLNNFEDFKIATLIGKISDYTPYIKHTQGVTSPDDAVYQRRRYLLQENVAIEQIAETATEDEQVYIINKHQARQYYESWLSSSGRVRRCLARAGYFPEILINDKEAAVRCDVIEQYPEYLPKLFRKEITKKEWITIIDTLWRQKHPDYNLLKDLLNREAPQHLLEYSYNRLDNLKEKFTAMNYVPITIEKTMTTKQLYQQNSPAWKLNHSAEEISTIHLAEDLLTSMKMPDALRKHWSLLINGDNIPPFTTLKSRIHTLIVA